MEEQLVSRIDDVLSTRRGPPGGDLGEEDEERVQSSEPCGDRLQAELQEWSLLSRELRRFDLPLFHPPQTNPPPSAGLHLDLQQSSALRTLLRALLTDCDRRQGLLQELIEANNDLKQELRRQSAVSSKLERKAKDLKDLLETSARHIQDLTEEKMMSEGLRSSEGSRERATKELATNKARQLEKRNQQLTEDIIRLRNKLMNVTKENEERHRRQREVFQQLKRRQATKASPMDEKLLDIIDAYEEQLHALRKERDLLGGAGEDEKDESSEVLCKGVWDDEDVSVNYKALVKELQRKLQASHEQVAASEERCELLKLELDGRPSQQDLHQALGQLRRCQKLLRQHNIDFKTEACFEQRAQPPVYSTALADLDFLPLRQCRHFLSAVSQELSISNLDDLVLTAKRHRRLAALYPNVADFAHAVERLVDSPSAPPLPAAFLSARPKESENQGVTAASQDAEELKQRHTYCLAVLEFWLDQLSALPELSAALLRLHGLLYPWRASVAVPNLEVCAMVGFVDTMTQPEPDTERLLNPQDCPDNMAQGLIGHFQRLFDCPRLDAVYTRMTDVYSKLGELRNIIGNIAQALDFDREENPAVIYEAVIALNEDRQRAARGQLHRQIGPDQLAEALAKLEQYDDFFPTFQQLVQDLLKVLDLDSIDRILPAVKSLKRCVDL